MEDPPFDLVVSVFTKTFELRAWGSKSRTIRPASSPQSKGTNHECHRHSLRDLSHHRPATHRLGARNLFRNGRIFLVDCFHGNESLADSVNQLLVMEFYLVNFGFVALYLKLVAEVQEVRGIFEALSSKLGVVLLVLGGMHFFNLVVFTKMRKRATWAQAPPPLPPTGVI